MLSNVTLIRYPFLQVFGSRFPCVPYSQLPLLLQFVSARPLVGLSHALPQVTDVTAIYIFLILCSCLFLILCWPVTPLVCVRPYIGRFQPCSNFCNINYPFFKNTFVFEVPVQSLYFSLTPFVCTHQSVGRFKMHNDLKGGDVVELEPPYHTYNSLLVFLRKGVSKLVEWKAKERTTQFLGFDFPFPRWYFRRPPLKKISLPSIMALHPSPS